ncbi:hypothetical protein EJ05DRAFT_471970 [Pseudovirgaria hyperparasitica]|uniref:MOSC domain-containing protein n=1 Tax=Pseudovirgaria hyperparasitica TaxID=470096 RepID=A0A6A6WLF8_9PEZI|nr:uncharacterized protein EJ05DRAFT_471970 [Pseudovirgaria hyperparasitica]KAF2763021.1 hypothetical protein EJ05DRAFT_471970 [Pseudovirgaria hyperparasitica]
MDIALRATQWDYKKLISVAASLSFEDYVSAFITFALVLTIPTSAILFLNWLDSSVPVGLYPPAGCRKLGLYWKSNLDDQFKAARKQASLTVKALLIYPVKSCAPVELAKAEVVRTGLRYDRQFTFAQLVSSQPQKNADGKDEVEHKWKFITQREFPLLAKVRTEIWIPEPDIDGYHPNLPYVRSKGAVVVSFPFSPDWSLLSFQGLKNLASILSAKLLAFDLKAEPESSFTLPYDPTPDRIQEKNYTAEKMQIWKEYHSFLNVGPEIPETSLAQLKYFLGVRNPFTLFRIDTRNYREVFRNAPVKADVDHQPIVAMQDAYPLHIIGLSSVREVEAKLPEKEARQLDSRRFRANIIVSGTTPFAEDKWARIRIGSGKTISDIGKELDPIPRFNEYHLSCRTARCKLPNIDPATGDRSPNEPYVSMTKYRRIDEGAQPYPCLGMQSVPMWDAGLGVGEEGEEEEEEQGLSGWVSAGDLVEVLEETEGHFYIKQ